MQFSVVITFCQHRKYLSDCNFAKLQTLFLNIYPEFDQIRSELTMFILFALFSIELADDFNKILLNKMFCLLVPN